jgi:hypothetical protein
MKLSNVGQTLGTRTLELDGGRTVSVIIGVPQRYPEGAEDYFCPYQIVGIGDERVRCASGIDALQALTLTLKMIGADLYATPEAKNGTLSWVGQSVKGDLGFPPP